MNPLLSNPINKDFDGENKANILQKQFSSVFVNEGEKIIQKLLHRTQFSITDIIIVEAMVIDRRTKNLVALTK